MYYIQFPFYTQYFFRSLLFSLQLFEFLNSLPENYLCSYKNLSKSKYPKFHLYSYTFINLKMHTKTCLHQNFKCNYEYFPASMIIVYLYHFIILYQFWPIVLLPGDMFIEATIFGTCCTCHRIGRLDLREDLWGMSCQRSLCQMSLRTGNHPN